MDFWNFWTFESLEFWIFGFLDFWIFWVSDFLGFWNFGLSDFRIFGFWICPLLNLKVVLKFSYHAILSCYRASSCETTVPYYHVKEVKTACLPFLSARSLVRMSALLVRFARPPRSSASLVRFARPLRSSASLVRSARPLGSSAYECQSQCCKQLFKSVL